LALTLTHTRRADALLFAGTGGGAPRALVRCRGLALPADGAAWAAATTEGIVLYTLATAARFDPSALAVDVSVPSVHRLLGHGAYAKAAIIAQRLGDEELLRHALFRVPPPAVAGVAAALPTAAAPAALRAIATALPTTPHLQFAMRWARALCEAHGGALRAAPRSETAPAFRALLHALATTAKRLAPSVEECLYKLAYLKVAGRMAVQPDVDSDDEMDNGDL
jgi:periodic tryptophan protein 2